MKKAFKIAAALLAVTISVVTPAAAAYDYLLADGKRVPVAKCYVYDKTFTAFGEAGTLSFPQDLYISDANELFVADTGNNRVLILGTDGRLKKILKPPEGTEGALSEPNGVFLAPDGNLYVGDTGNRRIARFAPDGRFKESFGTPVSDLLGKDFVYSPRRVAVTETGYLYTIKDKSLMRIDMQNRFKGYIGATRLPFSTKALLIRIFASKQQRHALMTREPPPYLSFAQGRDGYLYATTADADTGQIMKLDLTGANMFPKGFYGEYSVDDEGRTVAPYFSDITADRNSVVTALDQRSGRMYQYDKDGNLLCVFGNGIGNLNGRFAVPAALDTDSDGNVYVLDSQTGYIVVYKPTAFIRKVHEAVGAYADGRYDDAREAFESVLRVDANYRLAHEGLGRIRVKNEEYRAAMESYRTAGDRAGYSVAFGRLRYRTFREKFNWVILIFAAIFVAVVFAIKGLRIWSERILDRYRKGLVKPRMFYFLPLAIPMLFDPLETGFIVKRDRNRFEIGTVAALFAAAAAARVGEIFLTHYPLARIDPADTRPLAQCALVLVPLATLCAAQYAVTAIFEGESKGGEIWILNSLSVMPYLLLAVPAALFSRLLGTDERGLYAVLTTLMWFWVVVLLLRNLKNANTYTFGQMLFVAVLTVFTMLLIWAVILLLAAFGSQFFEFVKDVISEIGYAVVREG